MDEFLYAKLLSVFVDDLIFEECIDMMWGIRTNGYSLDDIYNVDPLDSYFAQEKLTGNQTSSSSSSANNVNCPICSELVSGKRFAPHLEKCMNGGKRGSKRHYDYLHDDASSNHANSKTVNKQKSNESQDQQDAHPSSLVVRIRMKNGVPKTNQKRLGASLDDFLSGEVGGTSLYSQYKDKGLVVEVT